MGGAASVAVDEACQEGNDARIDEARCRALVGDAFDAARFAAASSADDGCVAMGDLKRALRDREADPAYDAAARALFARLGLDERGRGERALGAPEYNDLDAIWRQQPSAERVELAAGRNDDRALGPPPPRAALFVGNMNAASTREILDAHGITAVVCCIGNEGTPLYFADDPAFACLRFAVSDWGDAPDTPEGLRAFFAPLFAFVDAAVAEGRGVLVHCLAGADRAGTAGVAALMHLEGFDRATALQVAQAARPLIDPMGQPSLARCLRKLDDALAPALVP